MTSPTSRTPRRFSLLRGVAVASSLPFAVAALVVPRAAHAQSLDPCGNIDVRAEAECTVEVEGGCTAKCEPVSFRAACAAKLETTCRGECTVEAEASCVADCSGSCEAECTGNAGSLDCQGSCEGRCDADCDGACSGSSDGATCKAQCTASCSGQCTASCSATPPQAECKARCQASCTGSCKAKVNAKCQIDCQTRGYASCTAELEGGCKTRCSQPEGALFCDGQYVDTGDNLRQCIDALNAYLEVDVQASGSAACQGNECTAEGEVSCTTGAPLGSASGSAAAAGVVGLGIVLGALRRRRA